MSDWTVFRIFAGFDNYCMPVVQMGPVTATLPVNFYLFFAYVVTDADDVE
jgi:hypothetical protein